VCGHVAGFKVSCTAISVKLFKNFEKIILIDEFLVCAVILGHKHGTAEVLLGRLHLQVCINLL
jgi:hypothetical protein